MNKKQLQFDRLLAVLHQNSDYITAKSLSKQLNLSEKTVYRLVKEINQNYSPDELIIKKRGRGFKLNRLKNHATLINSKQNDFTPASRQLQILERLLMISPKKLLIMKKITGNDNVAMGHTGNIGYAIAGWIGKWFGDKSKSTEDMDVPQSFSFLRDSTVSIMLLMSVVYVILALAAGTGYVEKELSDGTSAIVYAIIQAGTFTAGFVVVLQGVRMILAEIVPAFQGIAKKWVPNSKPALDVPIIFSYAPNAVLIGFFTSFIVGTISMFIMIALHTTVIIPGVVEHFFCGAAAGIYGNSTGGRRGAVLGSAVNSLLISWLPLAILPLLGSLKMAASTFADTDYLIPGYILGKIGQLGSGALITAILAFVFIVIVTSIILNKRTDSKL